VKDGEEELVIIGGQGVTLTSGVDHIAPIRNSEFASLALFARTRQRRRRKQKQIARRAKRDQRRAAARAQTAVHIMRTGSRSAPDSL